MPLYTNAAGSAARRTVRGSPETLAVVATIFGIPIWRVYRIAGSLGKLNSYRKK